MLNESKPPKSDSKEREFVAKSAVSIFGAPISWVALFGALIGGTSIIPFTFYSQGGGFFSVGMGLFAPIAGVLLGPWAGLIAGTIGGFIGMLISPGAYPFGFLDVFFSGSLIPFTWGLMQPKYRKFLLVYMPLAAISAWLFPYYVPGNAIGLSAPREPEWILSNNWVVIALAMFLFLGPTIWRMYESEKRITRIIGLGLNMFMATCLFFMPYSWPFNWIVKFPYEGQVISNYVAWLNKIIPWTLAPAVVTYFTVMAVRRGHLRVVPNSWLDGFKFKDKIQD